MIIKIFENAIGSGLFVVMAGRSLVSECANIILCKDAKVWYELGTSQSKQIPVLKLITLSVRMKMLKPNVYLSFDTLWKFDFNTKRSLKQSVFFHFILRKNYQILNIRETSKEQDLRIKLQDLNRAVIIKFKKNFIQFTQLKVLSLQ